MPTLPPHRPPPALETAVQRVRMAARSAAERTIDSLALASLSTNSVHQRDSLLGAQYELNRKLAIFALTFNDTLDASVAKEVAADPAAAPPPSTTGWDALALVDDHEVEARIGADRFALEISHACEWEIREVDGYVASLLGCMPGEPVRNPLRAQAIGQALIRAVDAVAERAETRKVLGTEIGRALAHTLRQAYTEIACDLRDSGIRPIGLTVATQAARSGRGGGAAEGEHDSAHGGHSEWDRLRGARGDPMRGAPAAGGAFAGVAPAAPSAFSLGAIDPALTALIQRLNRGAPSGWSPATGPRPAAAASRAGSVPGGGGPGEDAAWGSVSEAGLALAGSDVLAGAPIPNLIHAHRDELQRAARNSVDQLVIDVIATLFDQILADAKVPPQVARLIARLQLPVLRAALGDPSFFSSRRHPVRRLVNRIASLGAAFDDLDGSEGQALIARMQALVQEIVDGDFERLEPYERALAALEGFVAEQARSRLDTDAGALLARKEVQLRVAQRFALDLDGALTALPIPDWLREFLARAWSRVIAAAEAEHGRDGALAQRARETGSALVLSVQPKGAPAQRKAFLQQLPLLMKDLNQGLDRIAWPDESRREFFARLLPAHAESLKVQPASTLEHNLLAVQVDRALATPLPQPAVLPPATAQGADAGDAPLVFSDAEAKTVGLVDEASVDWRRAVDIDLSVEPEPSAADLCIQGLPAPEASEPVEPMRGKSLADQVQIGFAYRMHLEGRWRKVRLAHVSAGRTFFVFHHGEKQRQTVSMTYRMLGRMCDSGRLRAFESAYLLERATARARQQLAELGARTQAPVSQPAVAT